MIYYNMTNWYLNLISVMHFLGKLNVSVGIELAVNLAILAVG